MYYFVYTSIDTHMGPILSLVCELKLEVSENLSQALNDLYALKGQRGRNNIYYKHYNIINKKKQFTVRKSNIVLFLFRMG